VLCLALTRTSWAIRTYEREEKAEKAPEGRGALFISAGVVGGIVAFALLTFIIRPFDLPLSKNLWVPVIWLAFVVVLLHYISSEAIVAKPFIIYGAFAGICGFFLHSFVDFDLYVPGIGQSLFVVMAAAIGLKCETERRKLLDRRAGPLRQIILVIVIAGFFFVFLFNIVRPFNEASLFYEEARAQFLSGEGMGNARELARTAVELDEDNAEYHFFLARIHHFFWKQHEDVESEDFIQAEKELLEASRLNDQACRYPLFLARLYTDAYWATEREEFLTGGVGEAGAFTMYERVLHLYPTNPKFWMEYGDVLAQMDKEKEMVAAYENASDLQKKVDQRHVRIPELEVMRIDYKIMEYKDKIPGRGEE
jgi:hypothetical protein